jgi:hypothetical protein
MLTAQTQSTKPIPQVPLRLVVITPRTPTIRRNPLKVLSLKDTLIRLKIRESKETSAEEFYLLAITLRLFLSRLLLNTHRVLEFTACTRLLRRRLDGRGAL